MNKASRLDIPIDDQRNAWNHWNTAIREKCVTPIAIAQAEWIHKRLASLSQRPLKILEVGCGTGWHCERLLQFGSVTGIDLADQVIERARMRLPDVEFIAGDFLQLQLGTETFDAVVSIDTLSHFVDQGSFLKRAASLLTPIGALIFGTQNGPVLERWSEIPGPQPGQVRQWVSHRRLRELLRQHFRIVEIDSICPVGDQGFLRLVNSTKLNMIAGLVIPNAFLTRAKERAMLGHSLMAFASNN